MEVKQAHFNLFIHGVGHHSAAWRAPESSVERLTEVAYYQELARVAERGLLDAVFFADGHSLEPATAGDGPRWHLEPLTLLAALAQATERIGLVSTVYPIGHTWKARQSSMPGRRYFSGTARRVA